MVTNICSMQILYSGFFLVLIHYTPEVFFVNFIHLSSWLFSAYWFKKGLYFDQTLCHKVFSDTLSFVTSFFEEIFSQSKKFYENNDIMVLSDTAKSGLGSAWIDGYFLSIILASLRLEHYARYDSENKDKPLPLQKIRLCYFFRAVYHSKNHVIPYCFIAGILNILQRWKTTIAR